MGSQGFYCPSWTRDVVDVNISLYGLKGRHSARFDVSLSR